MKTNKKIIQIGILLIMLTLIGCILFLNYIKLNTPVFLKNCIEFSALSNEDGGNTPLLQLEYITDCTDERSVIGISFLEAPDMKFLATETLQDSDSMNFFNNLSLLDNKVENTLTKKYGRYYLHTVFIYQNNYFKEDWNGEVELRTAEIHFNNGDKMTIDIGRIRIYSDSMENDNVLKEVSSTSVNNGSRSTVLTVENDITLVKLESALLDLTKDVLELKVENTNYNDISKLKFKKGSQLVINAHFSNIQSKQSKYDYYDLKPRLFFKNADGSFNFIRIYNLYQKRDFSGFIDVLKYLKEKEAI